MNALSVIIPFFDPVETLHLYLPEILKKIEQRKSVEVLLVDATQNAGHASFCRQWGVKHIASKKIGRSAQMNLGAEKASGHWLFFLHIDSIPPKGFDLLITGNPQLQAGCFHLQFDWNHWFLQLFAFFTRFSWPLARGGDQGLFVRAILFNEINGFKELQIMEDIDICRRLTKRKCFTVLPQKIVTSARKYRKHGVYRLQMIFAQITILYWLGASDGQLKEIYTKNIGG